jgi:hypothetical protein
MKRLSLTLSALAVLLAALIAAGCGSGGGSALGDALSFVPKDAPVVFAVKTDPGSDQYKNIGKIAKKFPGANQIESQLKQSLSRGGANYEKDVKPLLGNDLVAATPSAKDLGGSGNRTIVAIKVKDEGKAKELIKKDAKKIGDKDGAELYQQSGGSTVTTVKDSVIVSAGSRQLVETALSAKGGDHMSDSDFNDRLGDLDKDALVRVAGDMQTILGASPGGGAARKVKWVGALRGFGMTIKSESDGLAVDFAAKTEGDLTDQDLPIASGDEAAPILRRGGEIGLGVRDVAQIVEFAQQASKAANPSGSSRFETQKQKVNKQLGIDIDKDLIGQFTGNSSMSLSLDGKYAVRSEVKDPEALKSTLAKVADDLPKLLERSGEKNVGLAKPKGANNYYALATPNGKKVVFGVVDKVFVVASDSSRAGQASTQSPSPVAGAKGAVTLGADAEALVNSALRRLGNGRLAQAAAFTGPLGDMTGSMRAGSGSLTANLKLKIE